MIVQCVIVCRTNGTILSEFHPKQAIKLYPLQQIINQVIDHSRKLTITTYDNQLIHLCTNGMQIYYKAYLGVLFITIVPSQYPYQYLYDLFDMITQQYIEQAISIFKTANIPNRISNLQEARLKMFEQSLAIICRNVSGKSIMRVGSLNDKTHKQSSEIGQKLKELQGREQNFTSFNEINKRNPLVYQYRQNLTALSYILLCKKLAVIFLFVLTAFIGFYILGFSQK